MNRYEIMMKVASIRGSCWFKEEGGTRWYVSILSDGKSSWLRNGKKVSDPEALFFLSRLS